MYSHLPKTICKFPYLYKPICDNFESHANASSNPNQNPNRVTKLDRINIHKAQSFTQTHRLIKQSKYSKHKKCSDFYHKINKKVT